MLHLPYIVIRQSPYRFLTKEFSCPIANVGPTGPDDINMPLRLTRESALKVTLEGSYGTFRVKSDGAIPWNSLLVSYLQTHVAFDPSNPKLLKYLEPFRELFELKELDFDEIMQRDIDDIRVSTELIPYLLNSETRGAIKFFPPIVAVVLPVKNTSEKPSKRYPKIKWDLVKPPGREETFQYIQSGETGEEAFRFEYPMEDGKAFFHDLARLRLNTDKVRLVIIDGQHRAMALLALYRNLKN